ncbi:MAG: preprotein translocase subunit SecG [Pseudomonadota bacterium]
MNWLMNLMVVLQILAGLAIVGLVLVQHGKGADMGASFGSGSSGSLFGASGSANFLSRSTAVCAAIFFACTLALAFSAHKVGNAPEQESVLDRPASVGEAASGAVNSAVPNAVPSAVPGAAPSAAPTAATSAPAAASSGVPSAPAAGASQAAPGK